MNDPNDTINETLTTVKQSNHYKHGHSKKGQWSPEYLAWTEMKKRCLNPNCKCFARYGGRGITIAKEWVEDFSNFYRDMGPRPSPTHSIDRKDNDSGYCKDNCQWATKPEQCNNRRSNHILEFNGERLTIAQWCRKMGLTNATVMHRLARGWSIPELLTTPKRTFKNRG